MPFQLFQPYQRIKVRGKLGRVFPQNKEWRQFQNGTLFVRTFIDATGGLKNKIHSTPISLSYPKDIKIVPVDWEKRNTQYGGNEEEFSRQTCRNCRKQLEPKEECWYAAAEMHGFRTVCTDCSATINK